MALATSSESEDARLCRFVALVLPNWPTVRGTNVRVEDEEGCQELESELRETARKVRGAIKELRRMEEGNPLRREWESMSGQLPMLGVAALPSEEEQKTPRLPIELIGRIVELISFKTPSMVDFLFRKDHASYQDLPSFSHLRATSSAVKGYAESSRPNELACVATAVAHRLLFTRTLSLAAFASQCRPEAPLQQAAVRLVFDDLECAGLRHVAVVSICRHLSDLSLVGTNLSLSTLDELVLHLKDMPMERLDISRNNTLGWGAVPSLAPLVKAGRLKALWMSSIVIDGDRGDVGPAWQVWEGHSLRRLDVGFNRVVQDRDFEGLRRTLMEQDGLHELTLEYNPITDVTALALGGNTALKTLDLSGTSLTGPGLAGLGLTQNTTLENLSLRSMGAPLRGTLGQLALASNTGLRYLDLTFNDLEDDDIAALDLGRASIRTLHLTMNNISDPRFFALDANTSLRELNLSYGRASLSCPNFRLDANAHLERLSLRGCKLSFADNLARQLSANSTLLALEFSDSILPFRFLPNGHLEELVLWDAGLTDEGVRSLGLDHLSGLKSLKLPGTSVSSAYVDELRAIGLIVLKTEYDG